jgi:hypothetical protein
MLRELLETCRRVVGDEHPFTLRTAHNLGVFVFATGKLDEAETLLLEAWEGRVKVLGAEHPDSQTAKGNLAGIRAARASETDK